MNNQEAIQEFKKANAILRGGDNGSYNIAKTIVRNELAITALEAQKDDMWIPISSGKMPEERIVVDITIKEKSNEVGGYRYYTALAWYQDCKWIFKQSPYEPLIVSWRHRPEPWKEEQ